MCTLENLQIYLLFTFPFRVTPRLDHCCSPLLGLQLKTTSGSETRIHLHPPLSSWTEFRIFLLIFKATHKHTFPYPCSLWHSHISDAQTPSLIIICSLTGTTTSALNACSCTNSFLWAAQCQHPPFIKLYWKRQIRWKLVDSLLSKSPKTAEVNLLKGGFGSLAACCRSCCQLVVLKGCRAGSSWGACESGKSGSGPEEAPPVKVKPHLPHLQHMLGTNAHAAFLSFHFILYLNGCEGFF